jgi:hypothetical protein
VPFHPILSWGWTTTGSTSLLAEPAAFAALYPADCWLVAVDGVLLAPVADYTVDGSGIHLVDAVPSGHKILAHLLGYQRRVMDAPAAPTIDYPLTESTVGEVETFRGTAPPRQTVKLYREGVLIGVTESLGDGSWSIPYVLTR